MNITTFNKEFRPIHDLLVWDELLQKYVQGMSNEVLSSPVFLWDDPSDDKLLSKSNLDVAELIKTNPKALPFTRMRLWINANESDKRDGTVGFKVWLEHRSGVLNVRFTIVGPKLTNPDQVMVHLRTKPAKDDLLVCNVRVADRFVSQHEIPEAVKGVCIAMFTSLAWFIRDCNAPCNFIAKVCPDKKGKSVEWIQSRTHFVLIHKSHKANSKNIQSGAIVAAGDKYKHRQAHSRRAHTRVLRSERWGKNKGRLIRVKSCWVGPREWRDASSVYRMMGQ